MTESSAAARLRLATVLVGAGGCLLGLQRQATGEWVGTGLVPLGFGALIGLLALVFTFLGADRGSGWEPRVPRDGLSLLSALAGFAGVSFLVSAVLVPGGTWMFLEALVLVLFLSRGATRAQEVSNLGRGPRLRGGAFVLLALFGLFRLWVTHEGAAHRWSAVQLEVPILSSLPMLPARLKTVSFGEFSVEEFGIPWVGLDFGWTVAAWALGFALVAGGLWLRHRSAHEYENDRIQATIEDLAPELSLLVQRVLPEEEWEALGLHGLGERPRRKRIAALTEERVLRAVDLHKLYAGAARTLRLGAPDSEFGRSIAQAVERYDRLADPRVPTERTEEPG